jgi:alkylation response protein AidB-like acyl-CoA dehydrogenase
MTEAAAKLASQPRQGPHLSDEGLSEKAYTLLRETAVAFLKKEYACEPLHVIEEKAKGYSENIWRKVVEQGWTGVIIPEQYGGWSESEDSFRTLLVLLEQMGRYLFVAPYFSTMVFGAFAILRYGTEEQKLGLLPKIAEGEVRICAALQEGFNTFHPCEIATPAVSVPGGYELVRGTKLFVESAAMSDLCLCPARTLEGSSGWDGITLFLLDLKSPGVTLTEIATLGLEKQYELSLKQVKVEAASVLGELHQGGTVLQQLLNVAAVARSAEMVGALSGGLDMTMHYAMERVQYGKAIATNQVIQHYLANIWIDVVSSRHILDKAASMLDGSEMGRVFASIAKAWVGKALVRSTERCVQIHGAIGTTKEHSISYYYKQAKAWDLSMGSSDWHLGQVARALKQGTMAGLMA